MFLGIITERSQLCVFCHCFLFKRGFLFFRQGCVLKFGGDILLFEATLAPNEKKVVVVPRVKRTFLDFDYERNEEDDDDYQPEQVSVSSSLVHC